MDAVSVIRHDRPPAGPVLDLLRSLGVREPNILYALAARLPASASDTGQDPAGAARAILGEWFARLMDRSDLDAGQAFLLGRAAFVALDGASRYPGMLMADESPPELVAELRRQVPQP